MLVGITETITGEWHWFRQTNAATRRLSTTKFATAGEAADAAVMIAESWKAIISNEVIDVLEERQSEVEEAQSERLDWRA